MEPSDSKNSRVSSVFDPTSRSISAAAPARMRSSGVLRDRFTVDRGRPREVAERHLAPERRVGAREKIIPQLCLRLQHALGGNRGDRLPA